MHVANIFSNRIKDIHNETEGKNAMDQEKVHNKQTPKG